MTTIIRHGGESHVMRPDRVMRTSVLSPMMNYSPQADVQAVAQAFTQGPPLGTMLSGLGGVGFFDRVKIWWASKKAAMRGQPMSGPGPAPQAASQVAPQMQSQMALLAHLMQSSNPGHVRQEVARAAHMLQQRRPLTWYRAG